jgi:rhodanese-related sulfurtransferase
MDRITAEELRSRLAAQAVPLLDVRSASEYETAHIPGLIRVGLDELRTDPTTVASLLADGAVVVCRSGARAQQAGEALTAHGRHDIRVLDGGILAWQRAGGTLTTGRERWDLERQVRLVAGTLVVAGVACSFLWPPAVLLAAGVGAGLTVAAATNTCAMGMLLAKLP